MRRNKPVRHIGKFAGSRLETRTASLGALGGSQTAEVIVTTDDGKEHSFGHVPSSGRISHAPGVASLRLVAIDGQPVGSGPSTRAPEQAAEPNLEAKEG